MKHDPRLDFFEKHLPSHVSRALGDRLAAKRKPADSHAAAEVETPSEDVTPNDTGLPDEAGEPGDTGPRRVFMMPSEKHDKAAADKVRRRVAPAPRAPGIRPKVLGR